MQNWARRLQFRAKLRRVGVIGIPSGPRLIALSSSESRGTVDAVMLSDPVWPFGEVRAQCRLGLEL